MTEQRTKKKIGCEFCRGEIVHSALGRQMKDLRIKAGLSQKRLAQILSLSSSYLGDLELGRRKWTPQRVEDYTIACKGYSK